MVKPGAGMPVWSRITLDEYRALPLRAHALLGDAVPLHDAWRVPLTGGGAGRTVDDVRALFRDLVSTDLPLPVRALFGLRKVVGRWLRWDDTAPSGPAPNSFQRFLTADDRRRSAVPPGTPDGPFQTLYVFPDEAVSEIENRTVHACLVYRLTPTPGGYELVWGVHVRPVGRWTRPYMAAIDPFRRWIVYPTLLSRLQRRWRSAYEPDRPPQPTTTNANARLP